MHFGYIRKLDVREYRRGNQ